MSRVISDANASTAVQGSGGVENMAYHITHTFKQGQCAGLSFWAQV